MKLRAYVWRICRACRAPVVQPLPEGWSYTVERRPTGIDIVTPHIEGCANGFKKVEIPDV